MKIVKTNEKLIKEVESLFQFIPLHVQMEIAYYRALVFRANEARSKSDYQHCVDKIEEAEKALQKLIEEVQEKQA